MSSLRNIEQNAEEYVPHLLHLITNTRIWTRRRVVSVTFLDLETMQVEVTLDVDLTADAGCRSYVAAVEEARLPALILPLGLRQIGFSGFLGADYRGQHLSLLTHAQSDYIYERIKQHGAVASWEELRESNIYTYLQVPVEYCDRHELKYSYRGPLGIKKTAAQTGASGASKGIRVKHDQRFVHRPTHITEPPPRREEKENVKLARVRKVGKAVRGRWKLMKEVGPSLTESLRHFLEDTVKQNVNYLGHPQFIDLNLLQSETAESYHFDITFPLGTVIYFVQALPDGTNPDSELAGQVKIECRGGLDELWANEGVEPDPLWNPSEQALLYAEFPKSIAPQNLLSKLIFRVWIGVDSRSLLRPLLSAVSVFFVMVLNMVAIATHGSPNAAWSVPASFFLATTTLSLGLLGEQTERHEVTDLLYHPVHRAIIIAGAVSFAGFLWSITGWYALSSNSSNLLKNIVLAISAIMVIVAFAAAHRLILLYWRAGRTSVVAFLNRETKLAKGKNDPTQLIRRSIG